MRSRVLISVLGDIMFIDNHNRLHREEGLPAYIRANGDLSYYHNGELHRENDLPSYERTDLSTGFKDLECHIHGMWHRTNGPARYHRHYLYGILIRNKEFDRSVVVWKKFLTESNKRAIPCPEEWRKYYDENF